VGDSTRAAAALESRIDLLVDQTFDQDKQAKSLALNGCSKGNGREPFEEKYFMGKHLAQTGNFSA